MVNQYNYDSRMISNYDVIISAHVLAAKGLSCDWCGHVIKIWELCLIVTLIWHLYERSYDNHNFMWVSTEKNIFFEGYCWFKFINFRLAPGMTLKLYASVTKRFKLKLRKFWELILTLVEVTREKPLTPHPE